ncbi:Hexose_transporter [Hexamita inflata]|uniref:Hexose_transporter n=1 Tax=Hexamita inflata TaxID=28002 RepID=A0ABP1HGM2_9EUKA
MQLVGFESETASYFTASVNLKCANYFNQKMKMVLSFQKLTYNNQKIMIIMNLTSLMKQVNYITNLHDIVPGIRKCSTSWTTEATIILSSQSDKIFQMKYLKSFVVALTLGMSTGASGINPVLQYSTIIFKNTFNSPKSGTIGAIITACISLASCLITMPVVKRFKRKQLFNGGLGVLLLCFVALIIILYLELDDKTLSDDLVLCITSVMILSFNISSASLFYIVIGEIFPRQVKTACIGFAMAAAVASVIIQTYVFPHMNQQENYVFFLCWMFVVYIFVVFAIPETANKTLEEIELEMIPKKYWTQKDEKEVAEKDKGEEEITSKQSEMQIMAAAVIE